LFILFTHHHLLPSSSTLCNLHQSSSTIIFIEKNPFFFISKINYFNFNKLSSLYLYPTIPSITPKTAPSLPSTCCLALLNYKEKKGVLHRSRAKVEIEKVPF